MSIHSPVSDIALLRERIDPRLNPKERMRLTFFETNCGAESDIYIQEIESLSRKYFMNALEMQA